MSTLERRIEKSFDVIIGLATVASNMKNLPWSAKIFVVHTGLIVVSVFLMVFVQRNGPGPILPWLILPFLYLVFSGLPYAASMICGLYELQQGISKLSSVVATLASLLIVSAMGYWIVQMWPGWMGI